MANQSIYNAFERFWNHVSTSLSGKSNVGHTHDDRYMTTTELDSAFLNKADANHTHTELNYLSGIESNVQEQLDNKQATISGGASTITSSNLTTNRALISNSSGKVAVSAVTSTELGYLDGVKSNVQEQLDNKASSSHNHSASDITSGTLSSDRLPTVPITKGGTGATTAAAALTNLGITATASELNKLDGVTATTTELNYVDGVTSSIQTQLNNKASSTHTHTEYMATSNPVGTGSFSINRKADTTVGNYSVAEGYNCEASGTASHAEGGSTTASVGYSHAEGYKTTASGTASHAEGMSTTASGAYSHAEGSNTTVSGNYSHVEGWETTVSGLYSHAEGTYNIITTDNTVEKQTSYSTYSTFGNNCHVEGDHNTASGNNCHVEGQSSLASGNCCHAEGFGTIALNYQHVQGHRNDTSKASAGNNNGTSGTAFVIGNGTTSSASNACRITYAGAVIGKAAYQSTGADYAEYFEWADGNIDNEERIGYFVTFDNGEFIRKANEGEYILGIVSGNPAILGNNDECWRGQNEMDEWNRFIYVTETNEETGETYETYKVNPEYDSTLQYIPRADRPEWDAVGMLGVLSVRDDGTCQVNGYCKVADGGIATASDTGYRVIKRVTDNIVKVVFR